MDWMVPSLRAFTAAAANAADAATALLNHGGEGEAEVQMRRVDPQGRTAVDLAARSGHGVAICAMQAAAHALAAKSAKQRARTETGAKTKTATNTTNTTTNADDATTNATATNALNYDNGNGGYGGGPDDGFDTDGTISAGDVASDDDDADGSIPSAGPAVAARQQRDRTVTLTWYCTDCKRNIQERDRETHTQSISHNLHTGG